MAHEYHVEFGNPEWYAQHRDQLLQFVRGLDRFVTQVEPDELWLKDDRVANSWSYDMRLFFRKTDLLVEVSSFTATFFSDLAALLALIRRNTSAQLLNDDGAPTTL